MNLTAKREIEYRYYRVKINTLMSFITDNLL